MFDVQFSALGENYADIRADVDICGYADYTILNRGMRLMSKFVVEELDARQRASLLKRAHAFKAVDLDVLPGQKIVCIPYEVEMTNGRFDVPSEALDEILSAFICFKAQTIGDDLILDLRKNHGIQVDWPYKKFTQGEMALVAAKSPQGFFDVVREQNKLLFLQSAIRGHSRLSDMLFSLLLMNTYAVGFLDMLKTVSQYVRENDRPDIYSSIFTRNDADLMLLSPIETSASINNYFGVMSLSVIGAAFGFNRLVPEIFNRAEFLRDPKDYLETKAISFEEIPA
ncbi:MAG: hypothetical protein ING69_10610 [Rhodocyclaceae bacterium]|nr:hypothetical protein [Rhodocyclaceae bacterium]